MFGTRQAQVLTFVGVVFAGEMHRNETKPEIVTFSVGTFEVLVMSYHPERGTKNKSEQQKRSHASCCRHRRQCASSCGSFRIRALEVHYHVFCWIQIFIIF